MARQMKDGKAEARGWRGSADLWLAGAHALLAEAGVEAVKIGPLAARLGLSRTSFYWHFPDREALLAALVSRWRNTNTAALLARVEAPAASVTEAILNLFDAWVEPEALRFRRRIRHAHLGLDRPRGRCRDDRRGYPPHQGLDRDVRPLRLWPGRG